MSALDEVKEAFQGKRGKILLVGGGLAIAAYVWYSRTHATTADTTPEDTTSGATPRDPQTDPTVGNDTQGGTGTGRPTTNLGWLSQGTEVLVGRGVPAGLAFSALSKFLDGDQLTAQESAWVGQVLAVLGVPPEGAPPLNAGAPATGGSTGGTGSGGNVSTDPVQKPTPRPAKPTPAPPSTKPPAKPKPAAQYVQVPVVAYGKKSPHPWNSTISGIARHYGKTWPTVWNDSKNAGLRAKRKSPTKIQPDDVVWVKK